MCRLLQGVGKNFLLFRDVELTDEIASGLEWNKSFVILSKDFFSLIVVGQRGRLGLLLRS